MSGNFMDPVCAGRSVAGTIIVGPKAGGLGWYCSLSLDHEGDHEAYDLNDVRPSRFIARWTR